MVPLALLVLVTGLIAALVWVARLCCEALQ